ncbi:MAG: tRNA pseudouridine(55) synthase TruB [Bacteroidota bacterium]|nr:tRNA pseudouridine(55) synthase TruB [Bacteroidota bacterium]
MNFVEGEVLVFNKPYRWTSFDLVKKVRRMVKVKCNLGKIKVGHAGTLDPLASGLMIICTGRATKQINTFQDQEKEYIAGILLGKTTPSFDLETEYDNEYPTDHISRELVEDILSTFLGESDQIPPVFSAKFIDGKRAYEYARKGQAVEMRPNRISINEIEIVEFNMPEVIIRVKCSKGTYIRSLVRDIGERLNSGACMISLQRTAIGNYNLNNAMSVEEFENKLALL